MKKLIDKKAFQIIYRGKAEELKSQLENLVSLWNKNLRNAIAQDLDDFGKINSIQNKEVSDMYRRIYYSRERLIYRVNSSNQFTQNIVFPFIINESKEADKNFLEKNPSCRIET
ncbi:MAG: hypothetical protein KKB62_02120 [Nanoarchaeota archaeon]|nr:hypothetical protein [Nanoarchaeota archaeon]